jgi:hypothetical protein
METALRKAITIYLYDKGLVAFRPEHAKSDLRHIRHIVKTLMGELNNRATELVKE